jgi:outer membrane protein, heavy metal efflux system
MRFRSTVTPICVCFLGLMAVLVGQVAVAEEQWTVPPLSYPQPSWPTVAPASVDGGRLESPPGMKMAFRQPTAVMTGVLMAPGENHNEPPPALRLEDLEQIALGRNPTLVQARMVVRAAQGGYLQEGLYPNPTIGYLGGDIGLEGTAGQQGAVFGQEIVTSGKLRLGSSVAGHEVRIARHGLEAQRQRVLNDVRTGYYQVLLAQKMIDVHQELLRISQEIAQAMEKALTLQEVSRADALQVRIEAERARVGLEEVENNHQIAWYQLATVLGQPEMPPAALVGSVEMDLPTPSREEALGRLMAQSPELAHARSGVDRARCQVALQCAERVPNFEFEMWAKHDAITDEGLLDVGVGLPLPLFNRNQGNIVTAQAELIAAQREVERVELDLRNRFAVAFGEFVNARRLVDSYANTILPNGEESLRLFRLGLRDGEFGYLTLLTAQRTYFNDNLEYLASLQEFWARAVELDGMLLSGGLERPE